MKCVRYLGRVGGLPLGIPIFIVGLVMIVDQCMKPAQAQDTSALQNQASQGNAESQYQLAKAYFSGTGVTKNSKQGVEWLRRAANLEHPGAQLALSRLYLTGLGQEIPRDAKQAVDWLRRSAEHGYAPAEHDLAVLYRDGNVDAGVPLKPHEAATWFRKAARQPGSVQSQADLAEMLQKGQISKQEADWRAPEFSSTKPNRDAQNKDAQNKQLQSKASQSKAAPFSVAEIEIGLTGGITPKRLTTLVQQFGVDFQLSSDTRKRLADRGADDGLLATIAASRRSL